VYWTSGKMSAILVRFFKKACILSTDFGKLFARLEETLSLHLLSVTA
jgi:hypothetical protein